MEERILMWVQNENNENFDYMFYGNELLTETDLHKIKIIRDIIFNNPNSKTVWKDKNYSQSSVLKIKEKFVLTGILKNTDEKGRHLPFMFCINSPEKDTKKIILNNLKKIGKEVEPELINTLFSKIISFQKKKKIIYGSLLLFFLILLYKILK